MLLPYANLQIKHWNEGATAPLILPVHVVCNTSDEDLERNIYANSRRPGKWFYMEEAHGGTALLCGSGPSLADSLDDIGTRHENGATVFAMNAAAQFLAMNGIMPDYQILIDPRPQTAELISPARHHLFASQVHPDCFDQVPNAMVWHLQIETIDNVLPDYDEPFTLLGGAASVGNTALCLAYAMGYRNLQIFGYDSSHRNGSSHAKHQRINDGEPCCLVTFNYKDYPTSLTMKLQAERFMETARLLEGEGCKVEVHGSGLLPDMWNTPSELLPEREKYERMWSFSAYRIKAPGEDCAEAFLEIVKPDGRVIDFGCGTGRAALKMHRAGIDVTLVDFAGNCRDQEACAIPFWQLDLTEPLPITAPYGYCTDVLEHIPPAHVIVVIGNVMTSAKTVFFQIATCEDRAGAIINQKLHLSVHPHAWWKTTFETMGYVVTHEDEKSDASIFVISRKD